MVTKNILKNPFTNIYAEIGKYLSISHILLTFQNNNHDKYRYNDTWFLKLLRELNVLNHKETYYGIKYPKYFSFFQASTCSY